MQVMVLHASLRYFSIILISGSVLKAFSGRIDTKFEEEGFDCRCAQDELCSSCTEDKLDECPFGDISEVKALQGGATSAVEGVAAWIVFANGKQYVVKFGGPMKAPLRAAQVAHALGVVTPRQLLITKESCPKLWSQSRSTFPSAWGKSLDVSEEKMISVQEHAAHTTPEGAEPNQGSIQSSFWYKAGAIAALDWILGKSDLFNDVPYGWKDNQYFDEVKNINLDNIFLSSSGIVAIDLDVDMGATRWEYWEEILEELVAGKMDITWFNEVMLPMLALKKSGANEIVYPGKEAFGQFNVEQMTGWDDELSPALTHLGFVDTLAAALDKSTLPQSLAGMPGLKRASPFLAKGLKQHLKSQIKRYKANIVPKQNRLLGQIFSCCKITCTKRSKLISRKDCDQNRTHWTVKLLQGQKIYPYGSLFYYAVPEKFKGDPNEQDCEQAMEKRPNTMMEQYCQCGGKAKNVKISMTTAVESHCSL